MNILDAVTFTDIHFVFIVMGGRVMSEESKKILEVKDLNVRFHTAGGTVKAVNGLSYSLEAGDALGIVGESGSGKSISSLAIMRLLQETKSVEMHGSITYKGEAILDKTQTQMDKIRGNEISMIFQEPMTSLNPILTCGFQIAEPLMIHKGLKKKEAMAEALELLKSVGIANPEDRLKQFPHQMSGGMRQRIMIAIALACNPSLIIADEPTTALDVTIQAQILDLMKKLNEDKGTAIIMITHDLGVVSELCKNAIVMYTGHCVEYASVDDLFSKPLHPYTVGLINSIPEVGDGKESLETIDGVVPNPTELMEGCTFCPRCPKALDKCSKEKPPMIQVSDNHQVRCWLYADKEV